MYACYIQDYKNLNFVTLKGKYIVELFSYTTGQDGT